MRTAETDAPASASAADGPPPRPPRSINPFPSPGRRGTAIGLGAAVIYLSLIVLIPLAAVVWRSLRQGPGHFWDALTTPDALSALALTIGASALVALINLVMGTLIAWVLVRDNFPGKNVVDTLIDMPMALPTIVAGLVLLLLYGEGSPVHMNIAYTRTAVMVALLFVTLPFVIRTVQPVLHELDRDMEQAAASLGAGPWLTFRRIILPALLPAMVSGTALSFARAIAEFGSTVLISGNIPHQTQVAAVYIFGQIESDNEAGAAVVSTVLLVVALVVMIGLDQFQRWGARRG